jgi:hypothetical protein
MRERSLLTAMGLGLGCLVACGGNEFSSDGAAAGTAGSNARGGSDQGGNDQGGNGGLAGATAGSATGGTAGNGGAGPAVCNCPVGKYCRDGSTDCFDCAKLSLLRFRPPEKLVTLSDGMGARFPRIGATGTDLIYQSSGEGLRYTTDSSTSAGESVARTLPDDRAPLLLSANVASLPSQTVKPFNFVFDRLVEEPRRALYFGQWNNGLTSAELAPSPYNTDGTSNFGLAIALDAVPGGAARAYWMSDRLQQEQQLPLALMTALLNLGTPEERVTLNIGAPACPALPEDLTPWITPDGATLFFSHTRLDAACAPQADAQKDLYAALMSAATGQPVNAASAAAIPLSDVNSPANEVDPSFSADFCDLYFASDRDGENALYRAHRR